ncbi:MAG: hypothetical protein ACM3PY_17260 [Omnitrophica WOR_2 bacterium]
MGIKIGIIGAGSSYTPDLFASLVDSGISVEVDEAVLMDKNLEAADRIARVSQGILHSAGKKTKISSTDSLKAAISGADIILLQVRVGGLAARVRDETLPMALGMVGNEEIGAGGIVCGLRNVTAILEIARQIERISPQAVVLCLANPSGMLAEALLSQTSLRVIGYCNIPINMTYDLAKVLNVAPDRIRLDFIGINHLGWIRGATVDGEECLQAIIQGTRSREDILYRYGLVDPLVEPEFLRALGMLPAWYLRYYYFPEKTMEEDRQQGPKGEQDMASDRRLAELYETKGYSEEARQILVRKGGERIYLPVLQTIDSIWNDRGDLIVADVKNRNATPDLPPESVLEIPARFYRDREEPAPIGPLPLQVRGLVQAVKASEQLTIKAVLTGDRGTALAALMTNPLVGSFDKASAFLDRALAEERQYLPQFFTSTQPFVSQ